MSYCRWSSDYFNCDLYCYEDVGGWWQTYVASSRHRTWLRVFHWLTDKRLRFKDAGYTYRMERFSTWKWPHWLTHKRIGLPHDGASFQDDSEHAMYERILWLNDLGYRVPKSLLLEIKNAFMEEVHGN